jgi:hypothetical protein
LQEQPVQRSYGHATRSVRNADAATADSMRTITFASVLTFATLAWMVAEADAYLYCELKGRSPKKEWARKECSRNAICGVKEECRTKCAKAKTPQQAEDVRSKRR